MKKFFTCFIAAFLFGCICELYVFANSMIVNVDYNFADYSGFVKTETGVNKQQDLTVSFYKKDPSEPIAESLIWADQAVTDKKGSAEFGFVLPDNMDEGFYHGKVKTSSRFSNPVEFDFYYLNSMSMKELVSDFKGIDDLENAISFLKKYSIDKPVFKFDSVDDIYFNELGEYVRLNAGMEKDNIFQAADVRNIVNGCLGLKKLNKTLTDSKVDMCLKENANLFGINIDEDYEKCKNEIIEDIITGDIKLLSEFHNTFRQNIVLGVLNKAVHSDEISYAMHKYYADYNIQIQDYEKYESEELNKAFIGKNFMTCDSVYQAYIKIKQQIDKNRNENSSSNGSSVKITGGGAGARYGGGSITPALSENSVIGAVQEYAFLDIVNVDWAREQINALYKKGIINGKEDGLFMPFDNVTREEFVKMIVIAFDIYNKDAECEFKDVKKDDWFYSYISSAAEKGIIKGEDGNIFGTRQLITREDLVTIIARMIRVADEESLENCSFLDMDEVSEYAESSVITLSKNGIIVGDGGLFRPRDYASRAEAAVIIYRTLVLEGIL